VHGLAQNLLPPQHEFRFERLAHTRHETQRRQVQPRRRIRTGDLAKRDEDGYYWFVGRADDVIISAGHLISPFEVETSLIEHAAVEDAGVIGIPDPVVGQLVKAYVKLLDDATPSDDLRQEILDFAETRLGPAVAPVALDFVDDLPKSQNGKILRRLLKARELGLPTGDSSTVDDSTVDDSPSTR
jgi:acetyl-CoA synthetase